MNNDFYKKWSILIIRILAVLLFLAAFIIAGLQFSSIADGNPELKELFTNIYLIFDNIFRGFVFFAAAILVLGYFKKKKRILSRKRTLRGFAITTGILLIAAPVFLGGWEFYLAYMPFPWNSMPFQLLTRGAFFSSHFHPIMGIDGLTVMMWIYCLYQIVAFAGTIIMGRRWQCSRICMMNGLHAESFGPAMPVTSIFLETKKGKNLKKGAVKFFKIFQIIIFAFNLLLMILWIIYLATGKPPLPEEMLLTVETLKYLIFELLIFMFLWFLIGGRGYCYYCPAGTAMGLIGKAVGQKIRTGLTHCTSCGLCNKVCKMSVDIKSKAEKGEPVTTIQCVGCGICEDNCPTGNLKYETRFLK